MHDWIISLYSCRFAVGSDGGAQTHVSWVPEARVNGSLRAIKIITSYEIMTALFFSLTCDFQGMTILNCH
jgi:hypothetical protein